MPFKKGQTAWNKGIQMWKNDSHPRGMMGKTAWNKGKHLIHSGSFKKGHIGYKASSGKHLSEIAKEKLRIINLGNHRDKKTKDKISNTMKIKNIKPKVIYYGCGEKAPNWQGGLSFEPYSIEFNRRLKEFILSRDRYTCQLCGQIQNGHRHCIHHIDYDKKNCNPSNLITLCNKCHGKTNSNRNYWNNYFKEKIKIIFPYPVLESQNFFGIFEPSYTFRL